MENLIKKSVMELNAYKVNDDIFEIKLDANENPYDLFKNYCDIFMKEISKINLNRYPDANCKSLRRKLSQYTMIDEDNIICGNGSDEIIQMILNVFISKNDNIIIHVPTFPMYKIYADILEAKVIEVSCDDEFKVNIAEIIKKANEYNAKVIFLCNPNNPTGTSIKREEILKVLHETESIVVVDEAYYEFLGETVIDKIYDEKRLIVLRTLSKAFSLAGARIGYAAAAGNIIDALNKIRSPYNVNSFSQISAAILLDKVDDVKDSIKKINKEKEYIQKSLKDIPGIKVYKGCANFLLVRFENFEETIKLLLEYKISVKSYIKGELKNCIRVTIGSRYENDKFIEAVKRVVNCE
ncbi:histidinol-phosphate aminotransferase [Caloramator quimbayensis]|uniref:Histidinol-phosphate aminotransferase n=1 Tax=Caloramator quimbayensis TaxID=1147123 RepID=A0A1T4X689_9CLOT|nr:histidinol-phosphate transaminase [Caloramator quimbayensis]SKA84937.1 histidinol-phosphate aminotransferase [Caloramator quimbayensis]